MKGHIERQALIRPSEEAWDEYEVRRTGDREELGEALNDAENSGLDDAGIHVARVYHVTNIFTKTRFKRVRNP